MAHSNSMSTNNSRVPGSALREGLVGYQAAISSAYRWMDMAAEAMTAACKWDVSHRTLGTATYSQVMCEGSFGTAVQSDADSIAERKIVLLAVEEGVFEQRAGNRHVRCEAGTLSMMNVGRKMEGKQDGRVKLYSAVFPTHVLNTRCPDIEDMCCLKVPTATGLPMILHGMIKSVAQQSAILSADEAHSLSLAISELVDGVFSGRGEIKQPPYLNHYRNMITQLIGEYLTDPGLGPQMLSEKLGVSRSYLFSVARKCDISIEQAVLNARLERCAELLRDSRWQSRNITEIAYAAGFKDLSHFSRSFSARYGRNPRAYRNGA